PRAERLWPNQAKTVRAAAGQAIYGKVGSFWMSASRPPPFELAALYTRANQVIDVGDRSGVNLVPIFVMMMQDPAVGQREVGPLWYAPCNPPYAPPSRSPPRVAP